MNNNDRVDLHVILDKGEEYKVIIDPPTITTAENAGLYFQVADFALTAISASYAQTSSFASVALQVLQSNFTGSFSGSFTGTHIGDGSPLIFSTINTSQSSDSVLVVGNIYNNYENKQTTIFRNGDIVVSGSTYLSEEGLLVFSPRAAPETYISGGLFFSSSGEFFVGMK
jgi:hypothetical protein